MRELDRHVGRHPIRSIKVCCQRRGHPTVASRKPDGCACNSFSDQAYMHGRVPHQVWILVTTTVDSRHIHIGA